MRMRSLDDITGAIVDSAINIHKDLALQRRVEGFPFFEFFEAAFTMGAVGLIVAPCVIFHQNHQVGRFAFGLRKAAFH